MTQVTDKPTTAASPARTPSPTGNIVEIENFDVHYVTATGPVPACVDVSLNIPQGGIVGIAGESGSGKSTLIQALTRIQRPPAVTVGGRARLWNDGHWIDVTHMTDREIRPLRWTAMANVFQSAMDSLNPIRRLGAQFVDVIQAHEPWVSKHEALERAVELLGLVGVPATRVRAYPHEMSGGMRQRASIALALACRAELIVMDEPTTAVDVVMQRQILAQIIELRKTFKFAIIFVTHDLSLLLEFADQVAVMYAGRLVEVGPAAQIYRAPMHPYSAGLRDSFPPLHGPRRKILGIPGSPPNPREELAGCPFQARCPKAFEPCATVRPALVRHGDTTVACLLHEPPYAHSHEGDVR